MENYPCTRHAYATLSRQGRASELIAHCGSRYQLVDMLWVMHHWGWSLAWLCVVSCLLIPAALVCVKFLADVPLSRGLLRFRSTLKLSALTASVSVIPLANGAPDLLVSFVSSKRPDGAEVCVSSLLGALVFAWTLVLAFVVRKAPTETVRAPALAVFKEAGFSLAAVNLLVGLGLLGPTTALAMLAPLGLFALYLGVSCFLAKTESQTHEFESLSIEGTHEFATQPLSIAVGLRRFLWTDGSTAAKVCWLPLKLAFVASIPFGENPLIRSRLRVLIVAASIFCFLVFFEAPWRLWVLGLVAIGGSGVTWVGLRVSGPKTATGILDLLSILASVAWMKVFSSLLLDSVNFLCFTLGFGERFLTMLVLSVGNSVSDLFSNGAISAAGGETMALLGGMSSQVYNLLLGLSLNLAFGAHKAGFDIFGFSKTKPDESNTLILLLLGFAALACLNVLMFFFFGKQLGTKFVFAAVTLYLVFIASCVTSTVLSRFS